MIHPGVRAWAQAAMEALVRPLARLGVQPNTVTTFGFILSLVAAAAVWQGLWPWAAILMLVASAFDMLDGALARVSGQGTTFGAFFDSTLDRLSEGAIGLGLVGYFLNQQDDMTVLGTAIMLVGAQMVSYTRARAEGLGLSCSVGWFQRPERAIALGLALLFPVSLIIVLKSVIWLLAVLTLLTTLQRVLHVRYQLR
jgi:CDP-diacylglycerol--glycerol-3-phosphate 3-phosphatidyltransferase